MKQYSFFILLFLSLVGCSEQATEEESEVKKKEVVLTPELEKGKEIWVANCKLCHEPGLAHAPKIGHPEEWEKRIAKGTDVLISHALNGFNEMPARGANPELSDEEVASAVRYMVAMSR